MKTLFAALILALPVSANASWFQFRCISEGATTSWSEGHDEMKVVVTKRTPSRDGKPAVDKRVEIVNFDVAVDSEREIENSISNTCESANQQEWGIANWKTITSKQIRIYKADGSLFDRAVVGVSDDRTHVKADLTCTEVGNSEVMCEE